MTNKSNQRHVRNSARYEQFGSTNQNNHSEEVIWTARTRKLKKPLFAGENSDPRPQI